MELKECRKLIRGCEAFFKRLESLKILEENDKLEYPCQFIMFGFPALKIDSKEELKGRIKEIQDVLNIEAYKEEEMVI